MWIVICDMGSISYNWQYGTSLNFVLIFTASTQWGKIVYDVEYLFSNSKQFHEFLSSYANGFNSSISEWKVLDLHRNAISKDFDPIVLKPNCRLYRLSQESCEKKIMMHYDVNLDSAS